MGMTKETAMRVLGMTDEECEQAGKVVLSLIPDEPPLPTKAELASARKRADKLFGPVTVGG